MLSVWLACVLSPERTNTGDDVDDDDDAGVRVALYYRGDRGAPFAAVAAGIAMREPI